MVEHLGTAFARIWLLDIANTLVLQASAGLYTWLNGNFSRHPLDGDTRIALIARDRKPYLTNTGVDDPGIKNKEWARHEVLIAFAGYPLIIGNQLLGVMAMFARQPLSPIAIDALAMVSNNIALDIKRKQAENDRREIEEKFLRLFDRAPVPMTLARITDGAIVDVNEEFERVFGYTRQEALRKTAIELGINSDIGRRNREVAELVVRGSVRGIELDEAWS